MTTLSEARACVKSAEAHHRRLCEAYDRGENVTVALRLAHERLVRAKAALNTQPADNRTEPS